MSGEIKKLSFPDGVTVDAPTDLDVGGSGAGETNYNSNPNAETSTSGYITYIDAPAATPVDGTGGTSNLAFTRTIVAAEIIRGTASFKLSKDAVDRQGEGVSFDFAIDQADENKLLKFEFEYQTSSGYASDDIAVFIYDVDNAIMMTPSNNLVSKTATATTVNRHSVQWASSDSTNYRAIIHIASTSAVAYTMQFDNVIVGPGKILSTPVITGWEAFTPSITWTTNIDTNIGQYRRVGENLEIWAFLETGGVPDAATLTYTIPNGLTIDSSKVDFNLGNSVGTAILRDSTAANRQTGHIRPATTTTFNISADGFDTVNQTVPFSWGALDRIGFTASFPILEWSGQGTTNALVQDNLSEWIAYTPTITAGITGNAFGKWRRVGDSIEVRSYISVSGATGGTISISIPSGLTTDTSKLADSAFEDCVGDVTANDQGTSQIYGGNVHVDQSNTNRVRFRRIDGGGSGGYWTNTVPFAWSSSDEIFCNFTLPIVEYAGSQNSLVGFSEATSTSLGLVTKNKVQTKYLTSDVSTSTTLTSMTFNGLTTDKIYRVTLQAWMQIVGTSATESGIIDITHNSNIIGRLHFRADADTDVHAIVATSSVIFTAAAATVTFAATISGTITIFGNSSGSESFAQLEELNNYTVTTDFT